MISRLRPLDFDVLSLTTIATPHRGSAFADYMFESIGRMCTHRKGTRKNLLTMVKLDISSVFTRSWSM